MPAPKGNKFSVGNPGTSKMFDSPQQLQKYIDEYFQSVDNNPVRRIEFNGKDAVECVIPVQRPYTLEGLALHLHCTAQTLRNYQMKAGYEDYFEIITRARTKIVQQNLEYGLTGDYNAKIVALTLSNNSDYREKVDSNVNMTVNDLRVGFDFDEKKEEE